MYEHELLVLETIRVRYSSLFSVHQFIGEIRAEPKTGIRRDGKFSRKLYDF